MYCLIDKENKIINIINSNLYNDASYRPYHPWNKLWEQYTDIEPLAYAKKRRLKDIDDWTARKIVGGFTSNCTGATVTFDSDKDTQLTMQGIALNVNTPLFSEKYPDGCPIRGYGAGEKTKTVFMLLPEQVMSWQADLSMHIGNCKKSGWEKQAEVEAAKSVEEVDKIVLD